MGSYGIRTHKAMALASLSTLLFVTPACGKLGPSDETRRAEQAIDERLLVGMTAGLEEAKRRHIDVPGDAELPTRARAEDGTMHPLVKRWAFDGDGRLRGEGPSMEVLLARLKQEQAYDEERGVMCRLGPRFCAR